MKSTISILLGLCVGSVTACEVAAEGPLTPAAVAYSSITRISTDKAGKQVFDGATEGSFTADGKGVVLTSSATFLLPDANTAQDVFFKNLGTGVVQRLSNIPAGAAPNGVSNNPDTASNSGRVAYVSLAGDIVAGDTNDRSDVFCVKIGARVSGRVSIGSGGEQSNGDSDSPSVSPDGRLIAFRSSATNLVAGDTNGASDVFVKNIVTGKTTRVSTNFAKQQANSDSRLPRISPAGTQVLFSSKATNLVSNHPSGLYHDLYMKTLASEKIQLVTPGSGGTQANGSSTRARWSANGKRIVFESSASNLVSGDTNSQQDIFVRDLTTSKTTLVSRRADGGLANGTSCCADISPDGNLVAFASFATNLATSTETTFQNRIYVKNLTTGRIVKVSTDSAGRDANGSSLSPRFSPDGKRLMFESAASNLVAADTNGAWDLFVVTLK